MIDHEKYMRRCLLLARKGLGTVSPNPMVGAVIVHGEKVIAEGYTSPFGGPHAEVNAISKVKDKAILESCTLYVSLEPCSHFGKTPPCANLIVDSKIPKVIIGALDTFSKVNGEGIAHLKKNGVEVETGVLEKECRDLNRRFFTFHEKERPYIILKWAQTRDGFMDKNRKKEESVGVNWITKPETKSLVHLWRSQEMAILVGRKTIENDNPKLDVRLVGGKNPIRIILDPELKLNLADWKHAQLSKTILFNKMKSGNSGVIEYAQLKEFNVEHILKELHNRNILSILIEGGKSTLEAFIQANLWDEARVLEGKTLFKEGLSAPTLSGVTISKTTIGKDQLTVFRNS